MSRITSNLGYDKSVVWSPDGKQFVYSSTNKDGWEIWARDSDGSGSRKLTNNGAEKYPESWSSDGNFIVFSSKETGKWAIYTIKVIPICFVKLRFNALERAKRGMSEIMCGSDFTAL